MDFRWKSSQMLLSFASPSHSIHHHAFDLVFILFFFQRGQKIIIIETNDTKSNIFIYRAMIIFPMQQQQKQTHKNTVNMNVLSLFSIIFEGNEK